MSISITRYVDIQSGVGAGVSVAQRDLIGRFFADNPLIPADAVVEFDAAPDVALYFGGSSPEYLKAAAYFGFISKGLTQPRKVSFARWAKVANEARIFGAPVTTSVAEFAAIGAGDLTFSVGGQQATLVAVNLGAVASYADVAAAIQTAVRAEAGTQFATATVVYDAVRKAFNFTSSLEQAADITIDAPLTLGVPLGWSNVAAVLSPGVDVTPVADALSLSADASNNFGSFAFVTALTDDELEEASVWNAGRNVEFMFSARVTAANAAAVAAAVLSNPGTALTLAPLAGEHPEVVPMSVLAATAYGRRASVQNYMFQKASLTPSVSSNTDANLYDGLRVNYYGQTQTAGQQINFYQRGVLMGGDSAPTDMNTYANEIWLKDAAQAAVMGLFLAVPRIPANAQGVAQVLAILQDSIDRALTNGVISVGKPLTTSQKVFVGELTGDADAWHQVQDVGYWIGATVVFEAGEGGTQEAKIVYTLVYSKDDAIRKVEGQHVLV